MRGREKQWSLVCVSFFAILVVAQARVHKEGADKQGKINPFVASSHKKEAVSEEDGRLAFYKSYEPHIDVTPSARTCPKKEGLYLQGSFIYWQSKLNGFQTAAIVVNDDLSVDQSNFTPLEAKYEPGFKLGVGYDLNWDGWDLFANWTWLKSSASQTVTVDDFSIAPLYILTSLAPIPVGALAGGSNSFNQMQQKWHMHFNALDLEMGRNFFIGRNLSFRPFGGVKSGWIDYTVTQSLSQPNPAGGTPGSTSFKDNIWGIGPRIGANSRWVLGRSNVAISADVAGSLLYEFFHPSVNGSSESGGLIKTKFDQQALEPVIELFLGVDWGICTGKRVYVNLGAGYEAQIWVNQQHQPILSLGNDANLSFQGLTFNFKVGF